MGGGPIDLAGRSALVLCFDPEVPGVPLRNPGELWVAGEGELPAAFARARRIRLSPLSGISPEVVILHSLRGLRLVPILQARLLGARRFVVVDGPGSWFEVNTKGALALATERPLRRRLGQLPFVARWELERGRRVDPVVGPSSHAAHLLPSALRRFAPRPRRGEPRALLLTSEGQGTLELLLELSGAVHEARLEPQLVSLDPAFPAPPPGLLCEASLRVETLPPPPPRQELEVFLDLEGRPLPLPLTRLLEEHERAPQLCGLVRELAQRRPRLVHCWGLDAVLVGGVAAVASGAPSVVLSLDWRGLERPPTWAAATLAALASYAQVRLTAGSADLAARYSAWAGIARERIQVLSEPCDLSRHVPPSPEERSRARALLGWGERPVLVADPPLREMYELDFLPGLAAARDAGLSKVVVFSGGPLRTELMLRLREAGLDSLVELRPPAPDIDDYLGLADAYLTAAPGWRALAAAARGTPALRWRELGSFAPGELAAARDSSRSDLKACSASRPRWEALYTAS